MLRVGLVGVGAMGSNHARIISESGRARLTMVYDISRDAAERAASRWNTDAADSIEELATCDAVVVASPTSSHFGIGMTLINLEVAVLIEKPLSSSIQETEELIELSRSKNSVLSCGFVERFNPALKTALDQLDGPVRHINTIRHSPFNPRASLSVVSDLLIHDLDLTTRVAPTPIPTHVGTSRWAPAPGSVDEIADCTLVFDESMVATLSASRWSQKKLREVRLQTDTVLIDVDLIRMSLTSYRHRITSEDPQSTPVSFRAETLIEVPFVRHSGEPLALQFDHFLDLTMGFADKMVERDSIVAAHSLADLVAMNSRKLDNVGDEK